MRPDGHGRNAVFNFIYGKALFRGKAGWPFSPAPAGITAPRRGRAISPSASSTAPDQAGPLQSPGYPSVP